MGTCQWLRIVSPYAIFEPDDAVLEWRARMSGLFDGMAAEATAPGR